MRCFGTQHALKTEPPNSSGGAYMCDTAGKSFIFKLRPLQAFPKQHISDDKIEIYREIRILHTKSQLTYNFTFQIVFMARKLFLTTSKRLTTVNPALSNNPWVKITFITQLEEC